MAKTKNQTPKAEADYPRRDPVTDELRIPFGHAAHEKLGELGHFFYSLQKTMESNNETISCVDVGALLKPASEQLQTLLAGIEDQFDLALKGGGA